ncbi:hypothetical protein DFQ27_002317 [Actinomortierella ambigua]|uniref:Uncharacterized protein n=1 Tax=Actinomortierella ambigua TaxID=1343610 RepID=A0A9P6Q9W3_9FUNG|nr:hypothetical protein DFQ26_007416 [Actinomortierella ambigua]KAG0262488.1 hypothetical protein DFQ27_002317 [Actinomortierella ambigua]
MLDFSLSGQVPASALLFQVLRPQSRQVLTMHHGITLIPTLSVGVDLMGIGVVVVSIVGLCGVAKGCRRLMNVYFVFVLCFITIQVIFAVSSFFSGTSWVQDALEKSWDKAYNTDKTLVRDLQNEFNCQGFHTTDDRSTPLPPGSEGSLPPCRDILSVRFGKHLQRLGSLILCIRLIQLAGVFLLSILFKHLTATDDGAEQIKHEDSFFFRDEKKIEDEAARIPLLDAEEKGGEDDLDIPPQYALYDKSWKDNDDDSESDDGELQLRRYSYQDLPCYEEDNRETHIYVG